MTGNEAKKLYKLLEALEVVEKFAATEIPDQYTFISSNRLGVIDVELRGRVFDTANQIKRFLKKENNINE